MFDFIIRLRARPLAYRRKVAFWSAAGLTALIILIWGISLSMRFDDVATSPATNTPEAPGPFETFMGQVQSGISSIKNSFDKK